MICESQIFQIINVSNTRFNKKKLKTSLYFNNKIINTVKKILIR